MQTPVSRRAAFALLLVGGALTGCAQLGLESKKAPFVTNPSYSVFFESESVALSPTARQVVKDVAAKIRDTNPQTILVEGFAGKPGTPEKNKQLSRARVDAVVKTLAAEGVSPAQMLKIAKGEREAGLDAVGDRRVEITLTPSR